MAAGPSNIIQYIGLRDLEPLEQDIVKRISEQCSPRLLREAHNDIDITVHVKTHNKGGSRSKYSVHLKLVYANNVLDIDKVADWELPRAVADAFEAMHQKIKKEWKEDKTAFPIRKSTNKSEKAVKQRERDVSGNKRKSTIRRQVQKKRNRTY